MTNNKIVELLESQNSTLEAKLLDQENITDKNEIDNTLKAKDDKIADLLN